MPSTTELESLLTNVGASVTPEQEEALREAVCRFAAEARKEGMLPEAVIRAIHTAVKAVGNTTPDRIIQRVIEWCLGEYFRDVK